MTDKIESAAKAASEKYAYVTDRPTAIAIGAFAAYGIFASIRDGAGKVEQIRASRRLKKAHDIAVAANNPPSEQ
jgi:hypothetical protein